MAECQLPPLTESVNLFSSLGRTLMVLEDGSGSNANGNNYDGILARELQKDDIRMDDICEAVLGHKSPNSHAEGTLPITGVFATSGLKAKNIFQSSHRFGLGDRRVFAVDIDLSQLLGPEYSQPVPAFLAGSFRLNAIKCERRTTSHFEITYGSTG
eukprot:scaffold61634_cov36-Cyclotella_meneghiniana.AAC.4